MKVSAVIITYNEERNISRCLESLSGIVDEILVVDSFSDDRTEEICLKYGSRFIQNRFQGHIEQKNFAMLAASNDWILSLDADEVLSDELQRSITTLLKSHPDWDGYTFNRLTNYCGKWIRHCGWYPDVKLRLWNRKKGKWGGVNPHDKVVMQSGASTQHLAGDLLHYSYYSVNQHLEQINFFSDISSQAAHDRNEKSSTMKVLLKPPFKFFKDYFLRLGFLDGYYGYVVCRLGAHAKFMKYHKLLELQRKGKSNES